MKRRGFLAMLGLGGAGLALGVKPAPAQPALPPVPAPATRPLTKRSNTLITPAWFMNEVGREFHRALGGHRTRIRSKYRGTTHHHLVTVGLSFAQLGAMSPKAVRERYAKPIGMTLAAAAKLDGIRYFVDMGECAAPRLGVGKVQTVCSRAYGFSLRAVELYDIGTDQNVIDIGYRGSRA